MRRAMRDLRLLLLDFADAIDKSGAHQPSPKTYHFICSCVSDVFGGRRVVDVYSGAKKFQRKAFVAHAVGRVIRVDTL